MRIALMVVGLDPTSRETVRKSLPETSDLHVAEDALSALATLKKHPVTCVLTEVRLADGSGLDLLKQVRRFNASIDVVMVAAERDAETALSALKTGACDFLGKPLRVGSIRVALDHLQERRLLREENRWLREEARQNASGTVHPGSSPAALRLNRRISAVASTPGPVLIRGEVGSESEAVAREIHGRGPSPDRPFIILSCQGHGRESLENDLFGRPESSRGKGVPHPGKLEFAEDGSLFLDQADRMPVDLQERLYRRLAATPGCSPVRILAACTADPANSTRWNRDWESYLSFQVIDVPPLRERRVDIPALIEKQLKRVCSMSRIPVKGLTREAERFLVHYTWPGNLKELEDTIEIMCLTATHDVLGMEDLPLDILLKQMDGRPGREEARLSLKSARRHFERQYIRKVLEGTRGNQTQAAETLGLHRNTLVWKLRDLQMRDDYRDILAKRRGRAVIRKDH